MVENIVSRESRRKRRAHTHTRGVSTILFDIYGHLIPMRSRLFISFHVQHIDPYNSSVFGWAWFITRAKRKPSLFSFFLSRRPITPSSCSYGSYKREDRPSCFSSFPPKQWTSVIPRRKVKIYYKMIYLFLPQTLRVVGGGLRLGLYKELRLCQRWAALSTQRSRSVNCRTRCNWRTESRWERPSHCPAHERRIGSTFWQNWEPETWPKPTRNHFTFLSF